MLCIDCIGSCIIRIDRATVAILGCAGYTGQETLDRVLAHPEPRAGRARLRLARRASGASALDPRLNGALPAFVTNAEAAASGADVIFLCLGHEAAAAFEPPDGAVVVDLSGAHRLRDDAAAAQWYGRIAPRRLELRAARALARRAAG